MHLSSECILRWNVSGGHTTLEKTLDDVYGASGYVSVTTETKKKIIERLAKKRAEHPAMYAMNPCVGSI